MPMSYWMLVIMGFWSHGLERKSHDQPMVFDYRTDEEQVDQHHAFLWKEVLRPLPSRLQQPSPQYSFESRTAMALDTSDFLPYSKRHGLYCGLGIGRLLLIS
eukprot:symbB.v1.2.002964.t2/scaffold154.1/size328988/9